MRLCADCKRFAGQNVFVRELCEEDARGWNESAWLVHPDKIVVGEGERVWVGAYVVLDGSGGLTLGPGCVLSSGAQVYTHDSSRRDINGLPKEEVDRAPTRLGPRTYVGAGAIILKGVDVQGEALIGAGSVVTEGTKIGLREVWAGSPARFIRKYGRSP